MNEKQQKNRDRFVEILKSTNRQNIDYVIEDLDAWGFFDAPASARNHYNFPGGLAEHSLSVYDMAMAVRDSLIKLRPEMEAAIPVDSVAIAALLHDVCKTNIYRRAMRRQKNEYGVWEDVEGYEVDYSTLPIGHGEKSVIMLLQSGLDIYDDEMLAIRWHMGAWDLPAQSIEMDKNYRKASEKTPLVALIHTADTLSAAILEH